MTGALIVAEDTFVQALEGDEDVVRDLYAMARVTEDGSPDIRLVSNADKGVIVAAGTDGSITAEQESVLAQTRAAAAGTAA